MSDTTAISWCDATFNPWWGCAKVSPACDHCYAERDSKRFAAGRVLWGVDAERRTFGDAHWNEPLRWARTLPVKLGRRPRVFCASMADVFDKNAPDGARERLWALIDATPMIDWQLLTKRIGNVFRMVPEAWHTAFPPNVWMGATVVNQEECDRDGPRLASVPARVRFLSFEPMLGPINVTETFTAFRGISWVIAGGESGPQARPLHPDWVRSLRDQCAAAAVPFHFKQHGEWLPAGREPNEVQRITQQFARPTARCYSWPDGETLVHVGKRAAGRLLDGVEHNGFPEAACER